MISAVTGQLRRVEADRVHLDLGAFLCELLVPAADTAELHANLGRSVTLHTILYLEGDTARGSLQPRLLGFLHPEDRRFFELFTTVKGIGPRTALKALSVPAGRIAQAIESRDVRFLTQLKGIGNRTAELIIAELAGKLGELASALAPGVCLQPAPLSQIEQDALEAAVALGLQRPEAERLLDRVRQADIKFAAPDELLRQMLALRTVRG